MNEHEPHTCILCGSEVTYGYGNNPEPLARYEDGRCCDDCNDTKVIPARLRQIRDRVVVPEIEEYDFHYTISGTVRATNEQEAWDQWVDLLTQPRFLEDGTEVTILTEGEL